MKTDEKRNIFIEGAISASFIAESIQKHNSNTEIGGHSIFLGQVRNDMLDNKEVKAIHFTSYQAMAEEKITAIRESIFEKYELICIEVYHSLGIIKKGEICLFVFTSSKHKKPAMQACNELVECIKREVPIWGEELFEDNSYKWKENRLEIK